MARDFGPVARREDPAEDFLALLDGVPFGLVQRCRFDDYPVYRAEVAQHLEVPPLHDLDLIQRPLADPAAPRLSLPRFRK